ncbi:MAG: SPOR domain-containing protein, partial [Blastocatellia bacterium]
MSPRIRLALATFFVCLCPWIANAQTNQIKGYAVQVAALSSQQSADELVRGLNTRGVKAYWVRGASYGAASKQGQFHRVRVGNFPTIQSAYDYAEKLLGSGLLDAYAIAA